MTWTQYFAATRLGVFGWFGLYKDAAATQLGVFGWFGPYNDDAATLLRVSGRLVFTKVPPRSGWR